MNAPANEFQLIDSIRRRVPSHPGVDIGIGDDAACLAAGDQGQLVTTDMLLEGVHFLSPPATPRAVAHKAINVNLSDIAAMGGIPTAAFVSICWPRKRDEDFREAFCRGLEEACTKFSVSLAGGDTNAWDGPLVISVTVVGRLEGAPWLRNGARPGDWIMVTGELGGSLSGRHLNFTPRVIESQQLRQISSPSSMIDISDGLSADLYHLLEESQVDALLYADAIPVAQAAHESHDDQSSLDHALGDGEDFELLFTIDPEGGRRLLESPPFSTRLSHIGEIKVASNRSTPQAVLQQTTGTVVPLPRMGWIHPLREAGESG